MLRSGAGAGAFEHAVRGIAGSGGFFDADADGSVHSSESALVAAHDLRLLEHAQSRRRTHHSSSDRHRKIAHRARAHGKALVRLDGTASGTVTQSGLSVAHLCAAPLEQRERLASQKALEPPSAAPVCASAGRWSKKTIARASSQSAGEAACAEPVPVAAGALFALRASSRAPATRPRACAPICREWHAFPTRTSGPRRRSKDQNIPSDLDAPARRRRVRMEAAPCVSASPVDRFGSLRRLRAVIYRWRRSECAARRKRSARPSERRVEPSLIVNRIAHS